MYLQIFQNQNNPKHFWLQEFQTKDRQPVSKNARKKPTAE